jgi:phenylalanyl-tRNA synthetase beta chain
LFDRYQPESGQLSLALEVTLQPTERTLTEADLASLSDKVIASAAKLGAQLRA